MLRSLRKRLFVLGLAAPALPAYSQAPSSTEPLTFTISRKGVQLVLPIGRRDLWHWRLPETPDNQREYAWEVVLGSSEDRGFGFYLFKFAGFPTGSGNLPELLRAGQRSVWERTSEHVERVVTKARIQLSPADSGVAISITDSWTMDFLFGSKPAVGMLRLQNPGRDLTRIPIRFEYAPGPDGA